MKMKMNSTWAVALSALLFVPIAMGADATLENQQKKPGPAVKKPPVAEPATKTSPRAAEPPKNDGKSKAPRPPVKPFLEQLSPEDQRRLMKLYQDDPAAYFNELGKIVSQLRQEEAELNQKLADALSSYRLATEPVSRKKYFDQIRVLTRQQFLFRLEETERRLRESEKRLAQLRKLYETRKKNAESIIEKRVQYLIGDPSQRW